MRRVAPFGLTDPFGYRSVILIDDALFEAERPDERTVVLPPKYDLQTLLGKGWTFTPKEAIAR